MTTEDRFGVGSEEIVEVLTEATVDGTSILLVGFSTRTVEEFAVGTIAALEAAGADIEILVPGREYRLTATGGAISTCILSEAGAVPVRADRPVLIMVLPGDDWPEGVERQAVAGFTALVDTHPVGGTVISRDPS